jgi:hypothetical protein
LFTPDVVYDLTDFGIGELRGVESIRDAGRALGDDDRVSHHVTNIALEPVSETVVSARSKGIGVMANGTTGSLVYEDVIERRQGTWRIRRRASPRAAYPSSSPALATAAAARAGPGVPVSVVAGCTGSVTGDLGF